jgi:hypothetical protein
MHVCEDQEPSAVAAYVAKGEKVGRTVRGRLRAEVNALGMETMYAVIDATDQAERLFRSAQADSDPELRREILAAERHAWRSCCDSVRERLWTVQEEFWRGSTVVADPRIRSKED